MELLPLYVVVWVIVAVALNLMYLEDSVTTRGDVHAMFVFWPVALLFLIPALFIYSFVGIYRTIREMFRS